MYKLGWQFHVKKIKKIWHSFFGLLLLLSISFEIEPHVKVYKVQMSIQSDKIIKIGKPKRGVSLFILSKAKN